MKALLKRALIALLTLEARIVLKKYKPKVIAVTGSVGKTTTKDAIYSVLNEHVFIRKSEKSFNSEVGIPLTVLGAKNAWNNPLRWLGVLLDGLALILASSRYPHWLLLEVGADTPGDIQSVSKWLKPHIVVVTRIPDVPVHVEAFPSPEAVVEEKAALVDALRVDGLLVLNGDDPRVAELARRTGAQVALFGTTPKTAFYGAGYSVLYDSGVPTGACFRIEHSGSSVPVRITGSIGEQLLMPVLATAAVCSYVGVDLSSVSVVSGTFAPPAGRMRILRGLKGTTIIDDSYNASPVAVHEALRAIKSLEVEGRKVAVLGDMLELGSYSSEEHKKVGKAVAEVADVLLTVGLRARGIAEGALEAGMSEKNILQYEEPRRAGKELELLLEAGDVVLVKGSQSMRMERVVKEVMAEPERASELLVRQESEWLER
ncbi:hypothetical protein COU17_02285 [Candidatus Kaiserbacteria bacterium CG10_big_fil_rev_8_21_14_0_10_49_17]|uniref:UDP-N-acetylmuramoyl-tripeptide--D-alanyl-D-alanine ligase n=1 Tax=Candidatus Kaiserbacteria bacterium CG10_big_fil_rev_8_21_14_0_10_49_17 TaxID=1974609 RepID=A0A2M6WEC2_9BACT|nr:MAG: hypothetical protein COU17_02285 [Candidatus Kaiserbacteria bacterium CG10_big_fil_rev_8_21_14_0_10_49_17]